MQPTLYLADTCSLRDAETRAHWERIISEQPDFCLTILFTVMSELRNQTSFPDARAALAFLEEHAEHVILLPEEDGFPAKPKPAADREIVYYCALRQDQEVIVYTEDQGLTSALTRINPLLEVRRVKNGMVTSPSSSWVKRYATIAEHHIVYLTAACVNSSAFAAAMAQPGVAPLFRGRMILSTTSLPLLNEEGKAVLRKLEERQLAPTLRVQGRLCISERDELMARLLTHSGNPGAMLWLGEGDAPDDYLDMSKMQFSALNHSKGYAVAVLKGNGRLYVLQSQATEAAPAPAVQTEQAKPTPPQADSIMTAAEPMKELTLTNAEKKQMLIAWVLKGDVKNAGPLLQENHALIYDAVKVCLDRHTDRLLTLLNSLSQRKLQVPHRAFTYYVDTYLLKDTEALKTHVNDADFQKVIRRMIKKLMPSPDGFAEAIQALLHKKEELDGTEAARLQNLIDMVRTYADKK